MQLLAFNRFHLQLLDIIIKINLLHISLQVNVIVLANKMLCICTKASKFLYFDI